MGFATFCAIFLQTHPVTLNRMNTFGAELCGRILKFGLMGHQK
jgi:hypothetical protein